MAVLKYFLMSLVLGCGAAGVVFFYSKTYGDKSIGTRRQHQTVDKINHMGTYSVTNVTIREDFSVMGTSHLTQVNVEGACHLLGMTHLEEVTVEKELTVNGMAILEKVTCKGEATFVGDFKADESAFQKVSLTVSKAVIKNSKIGSLQICLNSGDGRQNVTVLELDNTIIEGDVHIDEKQHLELVIKGSGEVKGQITGSYTFKK